MNVHGEREERDPIVKLVVACCFLDFISQPFLTIWIAVLLRRLRSREAEDVPRRIEWKTRRRLIRVATSARGREEESDASASLTKWL